MREECSDSCSLDANTAHKLPIAPQPVSVRANEIHTLAAACGQGDASAMLRLSEYLRQPDAPAPGIAASGYEAGANMWLLRAAMYGERTAQEIVLDKIRQNPRFLNQTLIPYANFLPGKRTDWHSKGYSGHLLNAMGLLNFQPEENYLLAGINEQRTLLVWQEADSDSPDDDGFGQEDYYNMFFLDEFFQFLPEVPMMHSVSSWEITHMDVCKRQYASMVEAMQKAAGRRIKPALWTEFIPEA